MAKRKSNQADSGSNASFEAELWAAADALRNNMDAAEYKIGDTSIYAAPQRAIQFEGTNRA